MPKVQSDFEGKKDQKTEISEFQNPANCHTGNTLCPIVILMNSGKDSIPTDVKRETFILIKR